MGKQSKEPLFRKRAPDLETESMRIWKADKTTKKGKAEIAEMKAMDKDENGSFEVDLGNKLKFKCMGFNICRHKTTNEVLMAYKMKREEGDMILYYIGESPEAKELGRQFLLFSARMQKEGLCGEIKDVRDTLKTAQDEAMRLAKLK